MVVAACVQADATAELARKAELDASIAALDAAAKELEKARDAALDKIPNELDPTVPVSNDEKDNAIHATFGTPRPSEASLLHHHELLWMIDGFEVSRVGVIIMISAADDGCQQGAGVLPSLPPPPSSPSPS